MNEDLQELLAWLLKQAAGPISPPPPYGSTYEHGYRYANLTAATRVRLLIGKHLRCNSCGGQLDEDGDGTKCHLCCEYVSPEEQKRNDAIERGDYLRDVAKDERSEKQ